MTGPVRPPRRGQRESGEGFAVACVIVGVRTSDETPAAGDVARDAAARVAAIAALADSAGAAPIVTVVDRGVDVPGHARVAVMPAGRRDPDTALRLGLTQLANTPVSGALVWLAGTDEDTAPNTIFAVVEAARASAAPFVVPIVRGVRVGPVYCARDTWRELVSTPGGLEVVMDLYGARVREIEWDV